MIDRLWLARHRSLATSRALALVAVMISLDAACRSRSVIETTVTSSNATRFPTITTPASACAVFRVAEGWEVLLAPASTLRFSPAYGNDHRTVELEGAARFTVLKRGSSPLVVRAGHFAATAANAMASFVVKRADLRYDRRGDRCRRSCDDRPCFSETWDDRQLGDRRGLTRGNHAERVFGYDTERALLFSSVPSAADDP